jgi:uncharacterized protein (TIGR02001 family)
MAESRKVTKLFGAAGAALLALSGAALADGYEGSIKDAPADEGRKFTYSFSITGTSDYVFASGLDFEAGGVYDGDVEVDLYGGIKPTWGPLTFDLGVIYYAYPGNGILLAGTQDAEYLEFKAGVSGSPFENATLGATVYYSDDYFGETGEVWTVEGTAGYTFKTIGPFTPTISGLVGYQDADVAFNGIDSYWYWNAGLALTVEKLTFDFRYWDTDIDSAAAVCFNDYCGERFVFSATVALP